MPKIAVIGGGPAGVMCAIQASKNLENNILIFNKEIILNTILPTGGGRCNLAYAEFNFKELAKNYPRGEKFLYSIFSKFSTAETLCFFEKIGIKTYTQDDNRIFPVTNSSKDVKEALSKELSRKNIKKLFEKVVKVEKSEVGFKVYTEKSIYNVDKVVMATGGKGNGHELVSKLGHKIVPTRPALSSFITKEKNFVGLAGISLQNVVVQVFLDNKKIKELKGDFLFTHNGISGPVIYKTSSYCTYLDFSETKPLKLCVNLVNDSYENFDNEFLAELKTNSQKDILNIVSNYVPRNLAIEILNILSVKTNIKSGQLTKIDRQKISKTLTQLTFNVIKISAGEEIVTAGGVDLKEVDSKTMMSKIIDDLYFCGEILDIDGLTGGFNLQNCWSSAFVVAKDVIYSIINK